MLKEGFHKTNVPVDEGWPICRCNKHSNSLNGIAKFDNAKSKF